MLSNLPGIVLKICPSGKDHLIATILSPVGLVSFFVKHGQTLSCEFRDCLQPISLGEFQLQERANKIRILVRAEVKNPFSEIKASYELLSAAGNMVRGILMSQWHEKPSKILFTLVLNFLIRLPQSKNPQMFASIFLIKLLQYEGILDLSSKCSTCKQVIATPNLIRYQGMKFCPKDAPESGIQLEREEEKIICAIAQAKKFQDLVELSNFPIKLSEKIIALFQTTQHVNA
ncbi:DNA repair protein RecO [Chlamydia ibidis]|uniref:DNA repair protein RecO n=2 Tax=Chlamydia ibidis TaxID=1405396 RepID=S7KLY8_9CHLA|nr:DNA repair protein RecO [Chlamydia ibidis]EPP35460.1 DNA repair protein RecO [Chlamydia ibidis]EQM63129.1 DNA repair protein RecO [Chlamydia ibidis 10-1398/6]